MDSIKDIEQLGIKAKGKKELIRHLRGERLTQAQAIRANCYLCNGLDERTDCEVPTCPLHPFYAYNPNRINPTERKGEYYPRKARRGG